MNHNDHTHARAHTHTHTHTLIYLYTMSPEIIKQTKPTIYPNPELNLKLRMIFLVIKQQSHNVMWNQTKILTVLGWTETSLTPLSTQTPLPTKTPLHTQTHQHTQTPLSTQSPHPKVCPMHLSLSRLLQVTLTYICIAAPCL